MTSTFTFLPNHIISKYLSLLKASLNANSPAPNKIILPFGTNNLSYWYHNSINGNTLSIY